MISYLGSILYEAHKILLSQSLSLQLDILNARLPHGHCYQKPFFSWFLFLRSSHPSFLLSFLCAWLVFPGVFIWLQCACLLQIWPISIFRKKSCGYCVLSLYFPHILLFHFFSVTLSHMHHKYSHTWHLGKSPDDCRVPKCACICICVCVCQNITILSGSSASAFQIDYLSLSHCHTHWYRDSIHIKHAYRLHNHRWVYYWDTRAIHFIGG